jgi:hypothetical protein
VCGCADFGICVDRGECIGRVNGAAAGPLSAVGSWKNRFPRQEIRVNLILGYYPQILPRTIRTTMASQGIAA